MTGEVTYEGRTTKVEGFGYRDHSWGPRDWQSGMLNHRWFTGTLGGELSFAAITAQARTGKLTRVGFIHRDGKGVRADGVDVIVHIEPDGLTHRGGELRLTLPAARSVHITLHCASRRVVPTRHGRHGRDDLRRRRSRAKGLLRRRALDESARGRRRSAAVDECHDDGRLLAVHTASVPIKDESMTHRYGYTEEHELFRRTARSFFDKELEPHYRSYAAKGGVDKEFWKKAGSAGLLGLCIPEEFGGPAGDFTYSVILAEELGASVGSAYTGSSIMADVATYILMGFGTPEQKKKYAAGILSGEVSQAMPLTEPDAGSDPTAIKATAVRDGKDWVINGEKYFISNGTSADVLYVVVKTDPTKRGSGMSIIIVDAATPGVTRHKIPMVGWAAGDTGALSFSNVRVPAENLLGQEGQAMKILMSTFTEDRLQIAGAQHRRRHHGAAAHGGLRQAAQGLRPAHRRTSRTRSSCLRRSGRTSTWAGRISTIRS